MISKDYPSNANGWSIILYTSKKSRLSHIEIRQSRVSKRPKAQKDNGRNKKWTFMGRCEDDPDKERSTNQLLLDENNNIDSESKKQKDYVQTYILYAINNM